MLSQRKNKRIYINKTFFSSFQIRYNHKTYKIDDIAWDKTPQLTFSRRDGKDISLIDYYQEVLYKNIVIKITGFCLFIISVINYKLLIIHNHYLYQNHHDEIDVLE